MWFYSGGEYDGDRKMDDLKLLYRAYASEAVSDGSLHDSSVSVNQLSQNHVGSVDFCETEVTERDNTHLF